MRGLKIVSKVFGGVMLILALAIPLVLIYGISRQEMDQYVAPVQGNYTPSTYGTGEMVTRQDMEESIKVSGSFVSTSYAFQELNDENSGKIRWLVSVGEMVESGQTLGLYEGEPVIAEVTGIIESISLSFENAYIQYITMDGLELECRVEDKTLSILEDGGLTTGEGELVSLTYTAPFKNTDGTTTVRLSVEGMDGYIGLSVVDLKIFTGRIFYDSLVISEKCVYQKESGEDAAWYVRRVSETGYFIDEVEVTPGYSDGEMVSVTGVSEGDFCDNGYKAVISGQ